MKAFITFLFVSMIGSALHAQSPSACFRDWQNAPVIVVPPEPVDSGIHWTSFIGHDESFDRKTNIWFDIDDYYNEVDGCFTGPIKVANVVDPIHPERLPAGAVFCRMETYTYLKCHVNLTIHAGGFNEKAEIDH